MKYLSLDIETTGLDPNIHQIIEIGAVLEYSHLPVDELPSFRILIKHKNLVIIKSNRTC